MLPHFFNPSLKFKLLHIQAAKSMIENYDMKFKAMSVFFAVSVLFKYLAPFLLHH